MKHSHLFKFNCLLILTSVQFQNTFNSAKCSVAILCFHMIFMWVFHMKFAWTKFPKIRRISCGTVAWNHTGADFQHLSGVGKCPPLPPPTVSYIIYIYSIQIYIYIHIYIASLSLCQLRRFAPFLVPHQWSWYLLVKKNCNFSRGKVIKKL